MQVVSYDFGMRFIENDRQADKRVEDYFSQLYLSVILRAIESIRIVVLLGRVFCAMVKMMLIPFSKIIPLRLGFCKSGYLPARIRWIVA